MFHDLPYTPLDQNLKEKEITIEIDEEKLNDKVKTFYQFYSKLTSEQKPFETKDLIKDIRKIDEPSTRNRKNSLISDSSSDSSNRSRRKKSKKDDKKKQSKRFNKLEEKSKIAENYSQRSYQMEKKDNSYYKYNNWNANNTNIFEGNNLRYSSPQQKKQIDVSIFNHRYLKILEIIKATLTV
jgi:hypothetical protein